MRRRTSDERGVAMPMLALVAGVLILAVAFSVDLGRLVSHNADLQKIADIASLDALREVDTVSTTAALASAVDAAALASAARNEFVTGGDNTLDATLGTWDTASQTFTPTAAGEVPDAVKVTVSGAIDRAFAAGSQSPSRSAISTRLSTVQAEGGSRLASVDSSQALLLDDIFTDAFGGAINVSAVGYTGLADADISIEELGTHLPIAAGTPDEVLTTSVTVQEVLHAAADARTAKGDVMSADILTSMAVVAPATTMTLDSVIESSPKSAEDAGGTPFNLLGFVTGTAFVADGDNAISLPSWSVTIPGVSSQTVSLEIIEGKQMLSGGIGTSFTTSQIRLNIETTIDKDISAVLAGGRLRGDLPMTVELGGLTATVTGIECDADPRAFFDADPSAADTRVDADVTLDAKVGFLTLSVLEVQAEGSATTDDPGTALIFNHPADFGIPKSVGTNTVGMSSVVSIGATNTTVLAVHLLGEAALTNIVVSELEILMDDIDGGVLPVLSDLLGVQFAGGDLTAISMSCGVPRLVA
jgi:uncharacterized membrane protein